MARRKDELLTLEELLESCWSRMEPWDAQQTSGEISHPEAQVDTRTPSPEQTGEASTEQGGGTCRLCLIDIAFGFFALQVEGQPWLVKVKIMNKHPVLKAEHQP